MGDNSTVPSSPAPPPLGWPCNCYAVKGLWWGGLILIRRLPPKLIVSAASCYTGCTVWFAQSFIFICMPLHATRRTMAAAPPLPKQRRAFRGIPLSNSLPNGSHPPAAQGSLPPKWGIPISSPSVDSAVIMPRERTDVRNHYLVPRPKIQPLTPGGRIRDNSSQAAIAACVPR